MEITTSPNNVRWCFVRSRGPTRRKRIIANTTVFVWKIYQIGLVRSQDLIGQNQLGLVGWPKNDILFLYHCWKMWVPYGNCSYRIILKFNSTSTAAIFILHFPSCNSKPCMSLPLANNLISRQPSPNSNRWRDLWDSTCLNIESMSGMEWPPPFALAQALYLFQNAIGFYVCLESEVIVSKHQVDDTSSV